MHSFLEVLWREFRLGVRLLAKDRSFAIVAGLTLALGIGATTAIFSVFDATVLAPLPYREPDRLVLIEQTNGEGQFRILAPQTLDVWREQSQTLGAVANALMGRVDFTLSGPGGAERILIEQVDFETFRVFGVDPILGRWFQPDEVLVQGNTAQTIVISYELWQRLGADPGIIGQRLPGWNAGWGEIVIGVMPRGFYTHPSRVNTDAWYIISPNPGRTIGRLAGGVSIEEAQAELDILGRPEEPNDTGQGVAGASRVQLTPLHDVYRGNYAETLFMLLGAVGFVLLIASVNVANLQLNRGVTRQAEMATRIALGAGRWGLFRQLVIENTALALAGGVAGILSAYLGIRLFLIVAPNFYPPSNEIAINPAVLLFTLTLCLAIGILSGLVPGLRASTPDIHGGLKQGGRGQAGGARLGLRRALVITEVALAMVLLVGAGLMINSYARLTRVDIGMDPNNVLTMEVSLSGMDRYRTRHGSNHYSVTPEVSNLYTAVLDRIAALPGVESVGMTTSLPPGGGPIMPLRVIGGAAPGADALPARYHEVNSDFFETMRIPLTRGRAFNESDNETAPAVAIISQTLAERAFADRDPIGQSIHVTMNSQNPELEGDRVREIVGIAGDTRTGLLSEFEPMVYVPYRQNLTDYQNFANFWIHARQDFAVRTLGNPASFTNPVRQAFAEVDPTVAAAGITPMREIISLQAGTQEFWMRLLGIFAGLGVFLAAIGIYGILSYTVEQRTREFGIRATFGAQSHDILRLVLREGILVTLVGLVLGVAGAFAATRLMGGLLYGVEPMDPLTIAAVALVLLSVSLVACYVPGRRATRLDPSAALRIE